MSTASNRLPQGQHPPIALTVHHRALLILWLMIGLYVVNFALLSILQNAAFETSAADLGNMNQAAWRTLHTGYPADTFSGDAVPRFGGHVEPVFYLLAIPYALWQQADMLLLLQTIVIALGAVPAYMLARDVLGKQSAGLAFAFAYLLFPSLQAANLTEFHPVALAATFLLFAFYYLQKGNRRAFVGFALLTMSTKEDMSLLVVMMGLYALAACWFPRLRASQQSPPGALGQACRLGLFAVVTGIVWFILCLYVIIPHFSTSGDFVLFQRYAEVGGSPQGLLKTLLREPGAVLARLLATEKLAYLAGLLLSTGMLALAAPWALLLAAPSLGINMLSNYAPMYSGLSHYSAPVVPFIVVGAIYGARFVRSVLQRWLRLPTPRSHLLVLAWLLVCASVYQILVGFTPLSIQFRIPEVTEHHRLLSRFAQQIPPAATVSALTPLHPHLSSRASIYVFPMIRDAGYVLVDVAARPTMHPNDLKDAVTRLVKQEGFSVLDAADGYILLQRGAGQTDLPPDFYSVFRTTVPQPRYPLVVDFGSTLRLLGYDIEDVDEGRQPWTRVRLYWQVRGSMPDDLRIYPYYVDEAGRVIEDTVQRPLVATLWYPPSRWQVGEVVVVQTLPWPVGDDFRLAVGVMRGHDWSNRTSRLPARLVETAMPLRPLDDGTAVELGRFRRILTDLRWIAPPAPRPTRRVDASFGDEVRLLGYDLRLPPGGALPGQTVRLTLYWQALIRPHVDYHTFAHIYDDTGKVAAQSDGLTGNQYPTSWWLPGQVVTETRSITIPAGPAHLRPEIAVGLYRLDSGTRLPVNQRNGRAVGDAVRLSLSQP